MNHKLNLPYQQRNAQVRFEYYFPIVGLLELQVLQAIGAIGTAIATITLAFLLYRTIKQMEATVKLSRIETEYRFRPWVGPTNTIQHLSVNENGRDKFDVNIKNFGEIPADHVMAYFKLDNKIISKKDLDLEKMEAFNLGPLLPNMEKHYWFFIDSKTMENAKEGKEKIFIAIYFDYPVSGGKSGYGMISEYNTDIKGFLHKEMWVVTPTGRTTHE